MESVTKKKEFASQGPVPLRGQKNRFKLEIMDPL